MGEYEAIATKEQYISALIALRDNSRFRTTRYLDILRTQAKMENQTITSTKMAEALDFPNYNTANLKYGLLGHELADALNYIPHTRKDGSPVWFWAISTGNPASDETIDGHYEFVMRPELYEALLEIRWVRE
ncbi:hypothetical protein RGL65_004151 [Vibrio parahaemolyticus]|uniref:hypothetical protein n=1 Tax=Vibrio diabolicus TaxID=50719 RepID=UPI0028092099|nr:hypothetical protein [Vibrio parahaemolyticus]ELI5390265.1 hypothetical protein [Vibrio parahaemolyticus]